MWDNDTAHHLRQKISLTPLLSMLEMLSISSQGDCSLSIITAESIDLHCLRLLLNITFNRYIEITVVAEKHSIFTTILTNSDISDSSKKSSKKTPVKNAITIISWCRHV